jgi:hypothetical protein
MARGRVIERRKMPVRRADLRFEVFQLAAG